MIVKQIDWKIIEDVWTTKLWKGRVSPIKPTNGLLYKGGYDRGIEDNKPTFFGVYDGDILVGVNSGHAAEQTERGNYYRSRGIYVFPDYRGKGIANMLLSATEQQALAENCNYLWSIPRKQSIRAYTYFGFIRTSDYFDEGMEFGPNAYVEKFISG